MNENKEVMASNIKYYMARQNVNATEVCKALGIKQNTFSDWVNAKTYPRIDKIERMANYFGVTKAHLVEAQPLGFENPDIFEAAWWESGGGKHPLVLSDLEYGLVIEYRVADEIDKQIVNRTLRLNEYAKRLNEHIKTYQSKEDDMKKED